MLCRSQEPGLTHLCDDGLLGRVRIAGAVVTCVNRLLVCASSLAALGQLQQAVARLCMRGPPDHSPCQPAGAGAAEAPLPRCSLLIAPRRRHA